MALQVELIGEFEMKRILFTAIIIIFASTVNAKNFGSVTIKGDLVVDGNATIPNLTITEGQVSDMSHTSDTDIATMGYSKFDPAAPGAIGGGIPADGNFTIIRSNEGHFGSVTAQSLILGPQPAGKTGELGLPEDPNYGNDLVGWKAPADANGTILWILPTERGTQGQVFTNDGNNHTLWSTIPPPDLSSPTPIGSIVPNNIYATDLVVDSIITNPSPGGTTESICLREDVVSPGGNSFCLKADTSILVDYTILVPSQLPNYTVTCPTLATDTCAAGQQCYDANYLYICIATDIWKRIGVTTW